MKKKIGEVAINILSSHGRGNPLVSEPVVVRGVVALAEYLGATLERAPRVHRDKVSFGVSQMLV